MQPRGIVSAPQYRGSHSIIDDLHQRFGHKKTPHLPDSTSLRITKSAKRAGKDRIHVGKLAVIVEGPR